MGVEHHTEGPLLHVYHTCGRVLKYFLREAVTRELQRRPPPDPIAVVAEARGILQGIVHRRCGALHERIVERRVVGFCEDHNNPIGNIGCLHLDGPSEFMEVTMEMYRGLGLLPQKACELHLEHLRHCDELAVSSDNPNNLDRVARESWQRGIDPRSDPWFMNLYDVIVARRFSVRDALVRVSPTPSAKEEEKYVDEAEQLLRMSDDEHLLRRFLQSLAEVEIAAGAPR